MIATVLDQPSPLRAVEHPKSKIVYYGARASNISADPRIGVIDKDCISLQKATDNPCAWKERLSLNTANRLSVFLKVAVIPPRTSIARGTNVIPIFAQLSSWRQYFLSSAASSAYSAFVAALMRELDSSDEVTVTSNAAGFPAFQVGTKMSPGRDWLSGIRFFFSTTGERFADEQADTNLFRIRSCLAIASPRPWHAMA